MRPTRRTMLAAIASGAFSPAIVAATENRRAIPSQEKHPLRLGVVADPQYADKPTSGRRRYREAADKLLLAVKEINQADVDLLVHLGDAIDGATNAASHLRRIFGVFAQSRAPVIHAVGNHCLDGGKSRYDRASGLVAYHGAMRFQGWRLVMLDGNAISIRGHQKDSKAYQSAKQMIAKGKVDWGGGLGKPQLVWLDGQLRDARSSKERVLVLCHFPVDRTGNHESHLLWDHEEVLPLLRRHDSVKAWFCGHNHAGGYGKVDGVHHVTFQAICEAPKDGNAWAVVELGDTEIRIAGHGTVPSRKLAIR